MQWRYYKMVKKTNVKKTAALIGAGALVLGGVIGGVVGYNLVNTNDYYSQGFNNGVHSVNVDAIKEQAFQEGVASVEPVVVHEVEYVNQTVEVPVDNGNLQTVLDEVYALDGNVSFLVDDLDDDELNLIVDRIVFLNDAKTLAFNEVEAKVKDKLDMYVFNSSVTFDEDEIYSVRMDFDDVSLDLSSVDFDDSEVEVLVPASFKQDGVRYDAVFRVYIEDSEVDDVDVESVALH
jgi:hypothetical protein